MDQLTTQLSPYRVFTRNEWAKLRADTPLTLSAEEVEELRGVNDRVNLDEVVAIYLPLSRLLNLYVAASQDLFKVTQKFLGGNNHKVPYIIGIAGSVAGGKSTTARILRGLLARWPDHPKVALLPTDGFLLPNAVLEREGLMNRKGFPESYDLPVLLKFLSDIKAGKRNVEAPVYSHLTYDIEPGKNITVDQPDILIVEGLNVSADWPPAARRQGHTVRVGLLRLLDLHRRRRERSAHLVRQPVLLVPRDGLCRSEVILPPLLEAVRRGSARNGNSNLGIG
jgi:type I pantothenate kinase